MRAALATLIVCVATTAQARPSPYPVTQFDGDRYSARVAQGGTTARDVAHAIRAKRTHPRAGKRWRGPVPVPRSKPGVVALSGVVAPLAAKAREIVAACGSTVISGVRHTYIAGTGGKLSLHASGRAVDITGNPACIYSHLRGSAFGYSTDYSSVRCRGVPCPHVHIDTAGRTFTHHGGHRKRHKHRRRA